MPYCRGTSCRCESPAPAELIQHLIRLCVAKLISTCCSESSLRRYLRLHCSIIHVLSALSLEIIAFCKDFGCLYQTICMRRHACRASTISPLADLGARGLDSRCERICLQPPPHLGCALDSLFLLFSAIIRAAPFSLTQSQTYFLTNLRAFRVASCWSNCDLVACCATQPESISCVKCSWSSRGAVGHTWLVLLDMLGINRRFTVSNRKCGFERNS